MKFCSNGMKLLLLGVAKVFTNAQSMLSMMSFKSMRENLAL